MKKHRGLTFWKSAAIHAAQHLTAFFAVFCAAVISLYSYAQIHKTGADRLYSMDLFAGTKSFDETHDFDSILMMMFEDIIRYNVARSQLETDGAFDGQKWIDVEAFVSRKDGTPITERTGYDCCYCLEDLLKWSMYGMVFQGRRMDAEAFLGGPNGKWLARYDNWTLDESQKSILESYLLLSWQQEYGIDAEIEIQVPEGEIQYLPDEKGDFVTVGIEWPTAYIVVYDVSGAEGRTMTVLEEDGELELEVMESRVFTCETDVRVLSALADALTRGDYIGRCYLDEETGRLMIDVMMLEERYKTVDDKGIADCAADWNEYWLLCNHVMRAVYELAYNYNEYQQFEEYYGMGNTNITYTFKMQMMGEDVTVSNLENVSDDMLDDYYRSRYCRYIIYRPESMTYESNTGVSSEMLFGALSGYAYAYPETAQLWVAVDTTYPCADDFSNAAAAYEAVHPWLSLLIAGMAVSIVLWIGIFLFLSVMTGWSRKKDAPEDVLDLNWFDRIPTEIFLFAAAGAVVCVIWGGSISVGDIGRSDLLFILQYRKGFCFLLGVCGGLLSAGFGLFWYSLLRRIKCRRLWKDSICRKFCYSVFSRILGVLKKCVYSVADNGNVWLRGVLEFGMIMAVNILLGAFIIYFRNEISEVLFGLFVVLAVDGAVIGLWCADQVKRKRILDGAFRIKNGEVGFKIDTQDMHGETLRFAEAVNGIGDGMKTAVETSVKDERLKTELITNVSHDIKTPLTSIINYVDLLKRERIETEPVKSYIDVLDKKSQRLKLLTDDLVEAAKISSGNITLNIEKINVTELLHQAIGEFSERFEEKKLHIVENIPDGPMVIEADSRRIWRIVENLFGNICKYAMENTRVYLDVTVSEKDDRAQEPDPQKASYVVLSFKNISAQPLNIRADELTERFIRGDVSRSTEGSGLGLSIAQNLTTLQNGTFRIYLDGDLFKVTLAFPLCRDEK